MAERLGVSVNTIKSLKKSAYVKLRSLLSKDLLMILFVLVDKYFIFTLTHFFFSIVFLINAKFKSYEFAKKTF